MGTWRCWSINTVTGAIRDELPLGNITITDRFKAPGAWAASLPMRHPKATATNLDVENTLIVFERDGVLVGGGPLLDVQLSVGADSLALAGEGMWNLVRRRLLRSAQGMTYGTFGAATNGQVTFTADDQFRIVEDLIDHMQSISGGDLGIVVERTPTLSGVTRDRSYDLDSSIGDLIERLADVDDGFDWWCGPTGDIDSLAWTLELTYPRRGRDTGCRFDLNVATDGPWPVLATAAGRPLFLGTGDLVAVGAQQAGTTGGSSNIVRYGLAESSRRQAIRVVAAGAGEGATQPRRAAEDPNLLGVLPLTETAGSWLDVTVAATLQTHADRRLGIDRRASKVPSLVVDPDAEPRLGAYIVGDTVRCRIDDGWSQVDGTFRIIGRTIAVTVDGLEEVTIDLAELGRFT